MFWSHNPWTDPEPDWEEEDSEYCDRIDEAYDRQRDAELEAQYANKD